MDKSEFQGKKALITGGTKGIGLTLAKLFAHSGVDVFLTFRRDQETAQMAQKEIKSLGVNCFIASADFTEENGIDKTFDWVVAQTPILDFYIHNAAATAFKDLLQIKSHHIDKTFNMSVKSFILGTQRAVALMQNGGAIVSVSGMDTLKAVAKHGLLGAAKSALETLTAYYAHELAPLNIRVNGVNPGFVKTESTQKYLGAHFEKASQVFAQIVPTKRLPTLEEIAKVILFLCSKDSSWIVGQTIKVDGGLDFALPTPALRLK